MTQRPVEPCSAKLRGSTGMSAGHGVSYMERFNQFGRPFDHLYHDYQQGTCDDCGELVYAERDENKTWSCWKVKYGYVIEEEPELADVL